MAEITLRVLDGADRGRCYDALQTPITIGREEGNAIQLNDERISRYHTKIQEDQDKLILTDLESTNGTKVNGEEVQVRILRYGDMISLGRSVLVFGSREQIARRLSTLRDAEFVTHGGDDDSEKLSGDAALDFELKWRDDPDVQATLHALLPPDLPEGLGPGQTAQLAELLEFLHVRLRELLSTVSADEAAEAIALDARQWQNLVDLQARVAEYLRSIGDPSDPA
jgi:pSer/pThr/pTyr-binding forkhead associated (FHA) protein